MDRCFLISVSKIPHTHQVVTIAGIRIELKNLLGVYGLWSVRDFKRATPGLARCLSFYNHIRRIAPFQKSITKIKEYRGPILTRILRRLNCLTRGRVHRNRQYCSDPKNNMNFNASIPN